MGTRTGHLAWAALFAVACSDDASGSGGSAGHGVGGSGGSGGESPAVRTSALGFQPWPYDATVEAVDWTWEHVLADGDAIVLHYEEGVPWPEALADAPFPPSFSARLADDRARVSDSRPILLSLNALDIGRAGLAPYRGASANAPLPAPWDGFGFDAPDVHTAYAAYVARMVDAIQPTWVLIGIESNLLIDNAPASWPAYVDLICDTSQALKARGVTQPLYVSLVSTSFFPEWTQGATDAEQDRVLADLDPCVDGFALSVHPFLSALLADSFPDDYFDRLFARSDRWVGVSESSYPAQVWSQGGLTWNGSPEKQDHFTERLLDASRRGHFQFTFWFAVRDYDALWAGALASDPVALLWRDTGMYDEAGIARPALTRWGAELAQPLAP